MPWVARRAEVVPEHLPLGVALGQPAALHPAVRRGVHGDREGQLDVPARQQDTDVDLGRFQSSGVNLAQRFAEGEVEGDRGQTQGVYLDVRGGEGGGHARGEGDHRRQRRGSGAGQRPAEVGGDRRGAALGDVGEQLLRLKDAQGLPYGSALHLELVRQPGLGGHALTRPQLTGPDAGTQLVGHLAG